MFRVFIPLNRAIKGCKIRTDPFGVDFQDDQLRLNIKLVCTDVFGNIKDEPTNCFTWAKRNSVICQESETKGIYIRLKINQGVFDFRKTKDRLFQIIVEVIEPDSETRTGASTIWELFPKRRRAETESDEIDGMEYAEI